MRAVQKIPTRRPIYWRIAESKPFAFAFYVAAVVAVILANLEQLA